MRKALFIIISVFAWSCSSTLPPVADDTPGAFQYYSESQSLLTQQKYDEALNKINRAIGINPNFARFFYLKGEISLKQEKYQPALNSFEKAIEIRSNYTEALLQIARINENFLKKYNLAAENYKKLFSLNNSETKYLLFTADNYLKIEETSKCFLALDEYRKESILQGKLFDKQYYELQGHLNLKLGKYESALQFAEELITLDMNDPGGLRIMAKSLFALNEFDRGILFVNRLLKAGNEDGDLYYYRGVYYFKKNNLTDAQAQFLIALNKGTNESAVYKYMAMLIEKTDPERALEYYQNYRRTISSETELQLIDIKIEELSKKI